MEIPIFATKSKVTVTLLPMLKCLCQAIKNEFQSTVVSLCICFSLLRFLIALESLTPPLNQERHQNTLQADSYMCSLGGSALMIRYLKLNLIKERLRIRVRPSYKKSALYWCSRSSVASTEKCLKNFKIDLYLGIIPKTLSVTVT